MEVAVARGVDRLDLIVGRETIAESTRILDELGHPSTSIEVFDRLDDGLTFGLGLRKAHGFFQLILRNINCRLHASILNEIGIQIKASWNPQR